MATTRRGFMVGMAGALTTTLLRTNASATEDRKVTAVTTIDTHAHIFKRGLQLARVRRYAPDYDAPLEAYLGNLDANGTSHGVLVQPSFLGTDNSFLLQALQAQPDRLRGIAVVAPDISREALVALEQRGIVGVRLNLAGAPVPDFRTAPWPAFLKKIADLGWQVEVQRAARDLPPIVESLLKSGVNVVVDHFGLPDKKLGVDDPGFRALLKAADSRRVWLKLSGMYRNGAGTSGAALTQAAIPLLRDCFGAERLMWGSDWPHTQFEKVVDYRKARAQLDLWIPDPLERKVILVDTPSRLFRFAPSRG